LTLNHCIKETYSAEENSTPYSEVRMPGRPNGATHPACKVNMKMGESLQGSRKWLQGDNMHSRESRFFKKVQNLKSGMLI
jgi:hypothetical protein